MSKDLQPKKALLAAPGRPPTPEQKDLDKLMEGYTRFLQEMNQLLKPWENWSLFPETFPVGTAVEEEIKRLPLVFDFLACRRSILRTHVHGGKGFRTVEESADRADETLGMFSALVARVLTVEGPESWSLRDSPDDLLESMVWLVCDLMHLAKAEEISWRQILHKARESYQVDVMEDLDGTEC